MSKRNISEGELFRSFWNVNKNFDADVAQVTCHTSKHFDWICEKGHEWSESAASLYRRQGCTFCVGRKVFAGFNDIATTHPDAAQLWNYEKNGILTPTQVSAGSGKKAWWVGACGHDQLTRVADYIVNKSCTICSGKTVLEGFNDLAFQNPRLTAEWHSTKNVLLPSSVTPNSGRKAWWLCEKNHEWEAVIRSRSSGAGCPVCDDLKNGALSDFPELVAEIHSSKNLDVNPDTVAAGSAQRIWWLCSKGHEWESNVYMRTNRGSSCPACSLIALPQNLIQELHPSKNNQLDISSLSRGSAMKVWWLGLCSHEWEARISNRVNGANCPICANKQIVAGVNDLASIRPEIVSLWHSEKNDLLSVEQVSAKSSKVVWWQCPNTHEWKQSISTISTNSCSVCSGMKAVKGENDLATTHPDLAAEWHPNKNGALTPDDITAKSSQAVWWLGECGHEWGNPISNRVKGASCLICNNSQILEGFNDLATTHPEIAVQWHPTKNEEFTPKQVTYGSKRVVWWSGLCSHEWETSVSARQKYGCPYCSSSKVLAGFNDLAFKVPHLMIEWHPVLNGFLFPSEVTAGSHKKVWWVCSKKHEWEAEINSRVAGSGCPTCDAHTHISKPEGELFLFLNQLGFTVEQSNRKVLGNRMELDLYIPDKKLGIEFNGLYWHSEDQGKGRNYHHDKYVAAKNASVQLLQVWEDDWNHRKPAILRALAHKLGVTDKLADLYPELVAETTKVFARKTKIVLISTAEAKQFLEQNHIQGYASGSYYVGLEDTQGILRALMVLKKEAGNTLNIVRYATSGSVTGGFTKLLTYATKTYHPDSYITFADHTISDGGLYENNGFVVDKEIRPDYMYVVKGQRKHKFGYRLKKFRTDPNLLWDENLSERELAILNNIPRIWDAGKTRYRLTL